MGVLHSAGASPGAVQPMAAGPSRECGVVGMLPDRSVKRSQWETPRQLPGRFPTTYSTHTTKEKGEPSSGSDNCFRLLFWRFKHCIDLAQDRDAILVGDLIVAHLGQHFL